MEVIAQSVASTREGCERFEYAVDLNKEKACERRDLVLLKIDRSCRRE
jgi:hypothetical protein